MPFIVPQQVDVANPTGNSLNKSNNFFPPLSAPPFQQTNPSFLFLPDERRPNKNSSAVDASTLKRTGPPGTPELASVKVESGNNTNSICIRLLSFNTSAEVNKANVELNDKSAETPFQAQSIFDIAVAVENQSTSHGDNALDKSVEDRHEAEVDVSTESEDDDDFIFGPPSAIIAPLSGLFARFTAKSAKAPSSSDVPASVKTSTTTQEPNLDEEWVDVASSPFFVLQALPATADYKRHESMKESSDRESEDRSNSPISPRSFITIATAALPRFFQSSALETKKSASLFIDTKSINKFNGQKKVATLYRILAKAPEAENFLIVAEASSKSAILNDWSYINSRIFPAMSDLHAASRLTNERLKAVFSSIAARKPQTTAPDLPSRQEPSVATEQDNPNLVKRKLALLVCQSDPYYHFRPSNKSLFIVTQFPAKIQNANVKRLRSYRVEHTKVNVVLTSHYMFIVPFDDTSGLTAYAYTDVLSLKASAPPSLLAALTSGAISSISDHNGNEGGSELNKEPPCATSVRLEVQGAIQIVPENLANLKVDLEKVHTIDLLEIFEENLLWLMALCKHAISNLVSATESRSSDVELQKQINSDFSGSIYFGVTQGAAQPGLTSSSEQIFAENSTQAAHLQQDNFSATEHGSIDNFMPPFFATPDSIISSLQRQVLGVRFGLPVKVVLGAFDVLICHSAIDDKDHSAEVNAHAFVTPEYLLFAYDPPPPAPHPKSQLVLPFCEIAGISRNYSVSRRLSLLYAQVSSGFNIIICTKSNTKFSISAYSKTEFLYDILVARLHVVAFPRPNSTLGPVNAAILQESLHCHFGIASRLIADEIASFDSLLPPRWRDYARSVLPYLPTVAVDTRLRQLMSFEPIRASLSDQNTAALQKLSASASLSPTELLHSQRKSCPSSTSRPKSGKREGIISVIMEKSASGDIAAALSTAAKAATMADSVADIDHLVGIPECLREHLWPLLARSNLVESSESYEGFVARGPCARVKDEIEKDIRRSLPEHPAFQSAVGCHALSRVLNAFAHRNSTIGYAQAMNLITSHLLLSVPEETAFWLLCVIVEQLLPEHYSCTLVGSIIDQHVFEKLLCEACPRLTSHFECIGANLSTITIPWFVAIFQSTLPVHMAQTLLDFILLDHEAFLFSFGVAVFSALEERLLVSTDEFSALQTVRAFFDTLSPRNFAVLVNSASSGSAAELVERCMLDWQRDEQRIAVARTMERDFRRSQLRVLSRKTKFTEAAVGWLYKEYYSAMFGLEQPKTGLDSRGLAAFLYKLGRWPARYNEADSKSLPALIFNYAKVSYGTENLSFAATVALMKELMLESPHCRLRFLFTVHDSDGDKLLCRSEFAIFLRNLATMIGVPDSHFGFLPWESSTSFNKVGNVPGSGFLGIPENVDQKVKALQRLVEFLYESKLQQSQGKKQRQTEDEQNFESIETSVEQNLSNDFVPKSATVADLSSVSFGMLLMGIMSENVFVRAMNL